MKIISVNKKAEFNYSFEEKYTAGVCLLATEVKSIRVHGANIANGYAFIDSHEVILTGLNIPLYKQAFKNTNHDPNRTKKLLLRKTEIKKIHGKMTQKNYTIVPTQLFINDKGLVKIEIALAIGKKLHDKRQSLKEKDLKRQDRRERSLA